MLRRIVNGVFQRASKAYTESVALRLRQHGLKYEDLLIERPEVEKALARLSPAEIEARNRRIKRAIDVNFKRKPLPASMQAAQEPLDHYLWPHLEEIKQLDAERALLNKNRG